MKLTRCMIGAKCWSDHWLVFLHGERQTVHQSETSKKKSHAEVKYVDKLPCHSEKLQENIRESLQTSNLTEGPTGWSSRRKYILLLLIRFVSEKESTETGLIQTIPKLTALSQHFTIHTRTIPARNTRMKDLYSQAKQKPAKQRFINVR